MKSFALASALAAGALVQAGPTPTEPELPKRADSMPTVTVSGNAFYAGSDRFYVRGIDYQPGGSSDLADPLADEEICQRDIKEFKKLGVNSIRVYTVDNSVGHDTCMNALKDAGIYLILDVNNPKYSINRYDPEVSYNEKYLQSVFATIDAFAKYDNTLAFFSGNEVINEQTNSTPAARYVKATTRDMRQYLGNRGYRKIPVGYSAADVDSNRMEMAHYMNCGTDDERSDFFAFNDYSWCNSDFATSGWDQKVKNFTGYGLPIFLSEYGCLTNGRDFGEVEALMGDQMTGVYSGGLMYEYTYEANKFGIVDINGDSVSERSDFSKYAKALKDNPEPKGNGGASSSTKALPCPAKNANWQVDSTLLPAIPDGAKEFMEKGAGTGPGLKGDGSQSGGGSTSSGDAEPGSGSATGSPNAAAPMRPLGPMDWSPLYVTGVVSMFTIVGAMLL